MADTKITALAAITTVDPAADVLPIVDISDTSMAASGTTKKITSNQILGAGGTATLASATITGAATVGTTLGVTGVSTLTGAVGVGATPIGKFDVYNTVSDTTVFIRSDTTKLGQIVFRDNADAGNQGKLKYDHLTDTLSLSTAATEQVFISSTGNVGVGVTPAGTGGCLQLKSGITFPATQVASSDANTLDDYEEGTFTPTVSSVGGTGIVYVAGGSDAGKYTKIGNLVRFTVNLNGTYTGTFSYIRIALPFTVGTSHDAVSGYNNSTGLALAGRTDSASARFIVSYPQSSGDLAIYTGSFNA